MTFEELRYKEVISIKTGEKFGYIDDMELDICNAIICTLIIKGRCKWFGLLGREDDIIIKWDEIDKIGTDTILVCGSGVRRPYRQRKFNRDHRKFPS